jgi:hypothetical protein
VKEQSHKSEMRAALRGDFERLRARREDAGATTVASPPADEIVTEPVPVETAEPVVGEPAAEALPPSRPSWLERLRNRR